MGCGNKMNFKIGIYTKYKNTIYRLVGIMNRHGKYIYIKNKSDIDNQCLIDEDGDIIREVIPEEIGETYKVETYALYNDHEYDYIHFGGEEIITLMLTGIEYNEGLEKGLNVKKLEKGVYGLDVPLSEVRIFERVKYFDKYKFFAGEGYDFYKEEDIEIENPEW